MLTESLGTLQVRRLDLFIFLQGLLLLAEEATVLKWPQAAGLLHICGVRKQSSPC